ncbi:MAG TPA: hypothetical protein ENJ95_04940 [Bacteroidetes bacterium]|nr:hypothetical protein [Bacteroidota bacterium]
MRTTIVFFFLFFFCEITTAQPDLDLSAFQYRQVGPFRGGRATTVTGVNMQPNVFYMGATGGGVWKTEDYGTTWKNISDGFFKTPSIGAIRVAENDPNIIYVGTGSDGLRSNVISGKGMYKSVDAGKTWQHIGLENVGQIGAVEINPNDHNNVFVAAIGQAFQPNIERGIFRTKDGGHTWEKVLFISDKTGFSDLEFMPSNPNIIYAAAWKAERKPWTIISGGKENGIYKSIDGGDNWIKLKNGLPAGIVGKIDLAVSKADSKILYALIEAPGKKGGLYRSDNQGETFKQISDNKALTIRPFYFLNVDADPSNAEVVYVNTLRFHKSIDGGKTWKTIRTPHGDNHDMWINPNNSKLIVQANDGGANVSHNGGQSWSTQFNQPTAELYQVEVDDQYPYWLYAGQQDNYSTISVPSLPPYAHQAGATGFITNTGGCETGPAVPKPGNPDIVYSNCKGRFSVYNKKTGQEKSYDVGARNMYGHNPKDLKFRFQRVSPIHVSPHDPNIIYHTSQYVHRTTDEGKTWEIISPDLTAFEPDKQVVSGSPITRDITGEEFYSTIYSIQESKIKKGLIWVGANDGPVHMTQDGGKNWKNVRPKKMPAGGRVDAVEPSPHNAAKAYIAVLRYMLGDWKPYIYKTIDFGKNWQLINRGIPADFPVRVIREDPDREGLLYAGTEFGIFISFDDGNNWQTFQQNMPTVPITDIKIHRKDLVISTMGRGFWILDNLSPLHQQYDILNKKEAHLFQPKDTYRYRYSTFRGISGLPSPEYPRPSVIIDYYLPEKTKTPISLEIITESMESIRNFVSRPDSLQKKSDAYREMTSGNIVYSINNNLSSEKGLHRFRWDMRHDGAWDENKNKRYQNGCYASPGNYTVLLSVDDQILEQSFNLMLDPRVTENGVSIEDVKKQEALSLKIISLLSEAKKMASEIQKELNKLKIKTGLTDEEIKRKEKFNKLKAKLLRSKGSYTQPMFISQVNYLLGIIKGADQLPGRDVYERYDELMGEFEKIKTTYQSMD